MKIKCPKCGVVYNLNTKKEIGNRSAKCKKCNTSFLIKKNTIDAIEESSQVKCPKCGNKQKGKDVCEKCGIIFNKYKHIVKCASCGEPQPHSMVCIYCKSLIHKKKFKQDDTKEKFSKASAKEAFLSYVSEKIEDKINTAIFLLIFFILLSVVLDDISLTSVLFESENEILYATESNAYFQEYMESSIAYYCLKIGNRNSMNYEELKIHFASLPKSPNNIIFMNMPITDEASIKLSDGQKIVSVYALCDGDQKKEIVEKKTGQTKFIENVVMNEMVMGTMGRALPNRLCNSDEKNLDLDIKIFSSRTLIYLILLYHDYDVANNPESLDRIDVDIQSSIEDSVIRYGDPDATAFLAYIKFAGCILLPLLVFIIRRTKG